MPIIHFFLADTDHPMDSGHSLWGEPLPDRNGREFSTSLTYGEYFDAVAGFCVCNACRPICRALEQRLQRPIAESDIARLDIFLEKHGAFYHPARVSVSVLDRALSFVINVAASADGRRTIERETAALNRLGQQRPFGWLPRVYGNTCEPVPMFLADWFDGYHEFHLTVADGKQDPSIVVWDGADPPCLISEEQSASLYRQASMILTACYDPVSTEQIFPWHHAAGDFVARVKGDAVDVKLITVRGYASMFGEETETADERALLDNLVVFFIHLSVRMRLDRIDGVSQIAWAPDTCVAPIVDGFFKGLDLTGRLSGLPDAFPSLFQAYFGHHGKERIVKMARQLLNSAFGRQREETQIIDSELERHVQDLCRCIGRWENN